MVVRPAFAALGTAPAARRSDSGTGLRWAPASCSAGAGSRSGGPARRWSTSRSGRPGCCSGCCGSRSGRRPRIGLAALAGDAALGGHPEVAVYVMGLGAASALLYLVRPRSPRCSGGWRRSGLAGGRRAGADARRDPDPADRRVDPQLKRELIGISNPMQPFYVLDFVVRHLAAAPTNAIGALIPKGRCTRAGDAAGPARRPGAGADARSGSSCWSC